MNLDRHRRKAFSRGILVAIVPPIRLGFLVVDRSAERTATNTRCLLHGATQPEVAGRIGEASRPARDGVVLDDREHSWGCCRGRLSEDGGGQGVAVCCREPCGSGGSTASRRLIVISMCSVYLPRYVAVPVPSRMSEAVGEDEHDPLIRADPAFEWRLAATALAAMLTSDTEAAATTARSRDDRALRDGRTTWRDAEVSAVATPPDGLTLKHHRDFEGLEKRPVARWAILAALGVLVVLGLLNVFGQRPENLVVSAGGVELEVYSPTTVRSGIYFMSRFTIAPEREIENATLVLDPGWLEGMTLNTVAAEPRRRGEPRRACRVRARTDPGRREVRPLPPLPGEPDERRPALSGRRPVRRRPAPRPRRPRRSRSFPEPWISSFAPSSRSSSSSC